MRKLYRNESIGNNALQAIRDIAEDIFSDIPMGDTRVSKVMEGEYPVVELTTIVDGFEDIVVSDDYKVFEFKTYITIIPESQSIEIDMSGPDAHNEEFDVQGSLGSMSYRPGDGYVYVDFRNLNLLDLYRAEERVDEMDESDLRFVLSKARDVLEDKIQEITRYRENVESEFAKVIKILKGIEYL